MQVGVDLLRVYNTILTLPTPNAPLPCGQLGVDVSSHQGDYEAVQVLSVDLRFDTWASHSATNGTTIGAHLRGQVPVGRVALSRRNYLRFKIYSTDESGSLN
ncbi:hypothetical protein Osc7112_2310 [Oscillatoria nigro-viridis PCC 7112]|uniref:Uncharacterized protein n=1 Tax=Phormidium nigroviride PCC 7112 TaxID=179408 RepID=K9VGZ8_9CYAN|nr:hypothetical protein [Oscillatoria nigro-viridis]AFZ06762.1 hypothetical protein Osc7112_2310 [Oscillatoria nigro-viridis PCC 7112]